MKKDLKFFKPSNGKYTKTNKIKYTCNPITNCPICEFLKPKTKWQKIKKRISKLWKR